jgi:hypothetical protein
MKVELDGISVASCTHGGVEKRIQNGSQKSEGKKQLGRRAHRWETDFKMYVKEIGCEGVGRICVTWDRISWRAFLNTKIKIPVP